MKEEKENWIDEVMNSHQGKARLSPPKDLFDRIPRNNKFKLISLRQMTMVGVAASVLLVLNTMAIRNINTTVSSESMDIAYDDQLVSDYNLY